ncbi:N-acyl amino acid synthase FeeM domain-containing protein [Pseudaminobacter sp. NGMCC 1.201702]|uniref:N-acyl amino acid synthase FeeM domain-containing protein n=1 Tax=Pseudaminobacter sp. NGMCC 1.201702 TaxID=3391825 RepID=UPI0039EF63CE
MTSERASASERRGTEEEDAPEVSRFAQNVSALLERTEYRRCDKGEDLEDIYRLRYKSYRMTDMVSESANQIIHDDLDEAPNCYKFGIYIDGHLVSTLRIHHVCSATPHSPSNTVYGDVLRPMLASGATFIDPSRFAADLEWSRVFPQIPYLTLRLAGMACFYFQAPYCLSTIREEHAGFYKRIYCSKQIGEMRAYPGLNYQVVLYRADVSAIRERSFSRYPFFKSTALEQRMLFSKPKDGELPPLTVLPTAKYLSNAA